MLSHFKAFKFQGRTNIGKVQSLPGLQTNPMIYLWRSDFGKYVNFCSCENKQNQLVYILPYAYVNEGATTYITGYKIGRGV